jgi:DNA-binding NarL/FixJ family response regulator
VVERPAHEIPEDVVLDRHQASALAPGDVVGAAAGADGCIQRALEVTPDVVLIDLAMPDAIVAVRALGRSFNVVALGVPEVERTVIAAAEAGVAGYVTREASLDDVVAALESVVHGEMICSPRIAATLLRRVTALASLTRPGPAARLTSRELEILELIELGLSNKEIAARLFIQLATVKNHVHNILEKLQVDGRAEAAAYLRGGHVEPHLVQAQI